MQVMTQFTPGAIHKMYALGGRNGKLMPVYVEATSANEALVKYAALPARLRCGDAGFAIQVEDTATLMGGQVFYAGFFETFCSV